MAGRDSRRGQLHGRPVPGAEGEEQLGVGGAALITSMAAQIKVCLSFGLLRARFFWIAGVVLFLASGSSADVVGYPTRDESSHSLPSAPLDSANVAEVSS